VASAEILGDLQQAFQVLGLRLARHEHFIEAEMHVGRGQHRHPFLEHGLQQRKGARICRVEVHLPAVHPDAFVHGFDPACHQVRIVPALGPRVAEGLDLGDEGHAEIRSVGNERSNVVHAERPGVFGAEREVPIPHGIQLVIPLPKDTAIQTKGRADAQDAAHLGHGVRCPARIEHEAAPGVARPVRDLQGWRQERAAFRNERLPECHGAPEQAPRPVRRHGGTARQDA